MDREQNPEGRIRLRERWTGGGRAWLPAADLYATAAGWLVKLELAGVDPGAVHLELRGTTVRVHGVRSDHRELCCHRVHQMEICYSRFERSFALPSSVEGWRVRTEYKDGMFLVFLDREV